MKYKILIVDDEPVNLRLLERLFRRSYEVVTAESGAVALKVLENHNVALIISDQRMPGMTGIEFLKQAAQLRPKTVRIILTGYTDVNDLVDGINSGVIYKYITKPWSNQDLQQTVTRGLEYYEAFKERHDLLQQNARLAELSATMREGFIDLISETVRTKDATWPERRGRLIDQAVSVADWLELDQPDIRTLTDAVKLSEIRRLMLPDDEYKEKHAAPIEGESDHWIELLEAIPDMADVALTLRLRFENYDSGQVSGEEIPVCSRILSVITAYESLLRSPNASETEAFETLERDSEIRFDPKVIEALRVIRSMDSTLADATVSVADHVSSDQPG